MANSKFTPEEEKEAALDGLFLLIQAIGGIVVVAGIVCLFCDADPWWIVVVVGMGIGGAGFLPAWLTGTFGRLSPSESKNSDQLDQTETNANIVDRLSLSRLALVWFVVLVACYFATTLVPGPWTRGSRAMISFIGSVLCMAAVFFYLERRVEQQDKGHSTLANLRGDRIAWKKRQQLLQTFLATNFEMSPTRESSPTQRLWKELVAVFLYPYSKAVIWSYDHPRTRTAFVRTDSHDDEGHWETTVLNEPSARRRLLGLGEYAVGPLAASLSRNTLLKLEILTRIANYRIVDLLGRVLRESDGDEGRLHLISGLTRCGLPAGPYLLEALLQFEQSPCRAAAMKALQAVGYHPKTATGRLLTEWARGEIRNVEDRTEVERIRESLAEPLRQLEPTSSEITKE